MDEKVFHQFCRWFPMRETLFTSRLKDSRKFSPYSGYYLGFWIIYWKCLMAKHLLFDFIIGKSINQYPHNWGDGLQYIIIFFSMVFILHGIYFDFGQFQSMIERFSPHKNTHSKPINSNKRHTSNKSMCWKDNSERTFLGTLTTSWNVMRWKWMSNSFSEEWLEMLRTTNTHEKRN